MILVHHSNPPTSHGPFLTGIHHIYEARKNTMHVTHRSGVYSAITRVQTTEKKHRQSACSYRMWGRPSPVKVFLPRRSMLPQECFSEEPSVCGILPNTHPWSSTWLFAYSPSLSPVGLGLKRRGVWEREGSKLVHLRLLWRDGWWTCVSCPEAS